MAWTDRVMNSTDLELFWARTDMWSSLTLTWAEYDNIKDNWTARSKS